MDAKQQDVPRFLYGTAWKENETSRLTKLAIEQGFRGIDTANQRKHYHEAAVGQAIQATIENGLVQRRDLFLQTKFTFQSGQDHRIPYDPHASITVQVAQSFASSLKQLAVDYIDSYVLHGPTRRVGLASEDWDAWHAMESLYDSGQVRQLGISNVTLEQLQLICQRARIQPRFVQNRCYAVYGWDQKIRQFCAANSIMYQGFSLLTANRDLVVSPDLARIAKQHGRTPCQIVFRFALDVGMLPLTGTTHPTHMREDLDIFDFQLSPEEIRLIERMAVH